MMASCAGPAFTNGVDHLAVRLRHGVAEALHVSRAMILEYLLNALHENTPLMMLQTI
jgi:hypothetical protein